MPDLTILLVGDATNREFRECRLAMGDYGTVVEAAELDAACALATRGDRAFDLIAILEAYPQQYAESAVERLRRSAPLARVVAILGSWCESEGRTGRPWPGVLRVFWHQWLPQFSREAELWRSGRCNTWSLPVTASEEERLLAAADNHVGPRNGRIAICCGEFPMQAWLAAACRRVGYATTWLRPGRDLDDAPGPFTVAIVDDEDGRQGPVEEIRRLASAVQPAPVIALLASPRPDDRERALAAGAAAILSKPLLVDDLYWQLDRLLSQSLSGDTI